MCDWTHDPLNEVVHITSTGWHSPHHGCLTVVQGPTWKHWLPFVDFWSNDCPNATKLNHQLENVQQLDVSRIVLCIQHVSVEGCHEHYFGSWPSSVQRSFVLLLLLELRGWKPKQRSKGKCLIEGKLCCNYVEKYAGIDPIICSIDGRGREHEPILCYTILVWPSVCGLKVVENRCRKPKGFHEDFPNH